MDFGESLKTFINSYVSVAIFSDMHTSENIDPGAFWLFWWAITKQIKSPANLMKGFDGHAIYSLQIPVESYKGRSGVNIYSKTLQLDKNLDSLSYV